MYYGNLATRSNFGNSFYSQVSVTPRYESRRYMVSLPLTYSFLSNSMKVGVGARIFGFFIGSDDALGWITKKQYGANVYVGGFIPFGQHRAKDTDGDHVSDAHDKCPHEYGEWENHGCPVPEKDDDKAKG